jgi:hypothetical protein
LRNRGRRVRDNSSENGPPLRVKPKDKLSHDAKVASRAANTPEQVGILRLARSQYLSAGCDNSSLTR